MSRRQRSELHALQQPHGRDRTRVRRRLRFPDRVFHGLFAHIHVGHFRQRASGLRGLGQQAHANCHQHIHRQFGRVRHYVVRPGRAFHATLHVHR